MNAFTNREEYLAAVKIWKAEYAQLTLDIRKDRLIFKQTQRELSKCKPYRWQDKLTAEELKAWRTAIGAMYDALNSRAALRQTATKMIEERRVSKIEAGRQMAAAR